MKDFKPQLFRFMDVYPCLSKPEMLNRRGIIYIERFDGLLKSYHREVA